MNKLFTKIVGAALGLTMAIGVGVAVSSASKDVKPVEAAVPSAGTTTYSLLFSNIGSTGWSSSYGNHTYTASDDVVISMNASKQTQTITDRPVTKGQPVTLVLPSNPGVYISAFTFSAQQWNTKEQTITAHYSTNGGSTYTQLSGTSTNFSISKSGLAEGTNAIKITFSSTSNQVALTSFEVTYTSLGDDKDDVDLTVSGDSSMDLGDSQTLTVTATSGGSPVSGLTYTFESSDTSVLSVTNGGVVTAEGYGTATIAVSSAATDDYNAGSGDIAITVVEAGVVIDLNFPDCNNSIVSNYTSTWTATNNGYTVSIFAANNNFTDHIRIGRNNNTTSYPTITTPQVEERITSVLITFSVVNTSLITEAKLKIANNSSFTDAEEIDFASDVAVGTTQIDIPTSVSGENLYYEIYFEIAGSGSNGSIHIDQIKFKAEEVVTLDSITVSNYENTYTAGSLFTLGASATITANYSDDSHPSVSLNDSGLTYTLNGQTVSHGVNIPVAAVGSNKTLVVEYEDSEGNTASSTLTNITINYKGASTIELNYSSVPLSMGATVNLVATITDEYADPKAVSWSTSSSSIATISAESGTNSITVTAVGNGTATITASANGHSATCTITVTSDPILNLKDSSENVINDATLEYFTGDTSVMIQAVSENVASPVYNWSNEDDSVVTIDVADEYCEVTIVGGGSSEVSVTVGALTRTVTFSITQSAVTSLTLTSSVQSGEIYDGTYNNTLTLTPAVTLVGNATGVINWSSSDTDVATVSSASTIAPTAITVTGVGEGTATITAASVYTPSRTATFNVTVTADEVTSLSWTKRPKFNSSATGFQTIWAGETTLGDLMSQNGSDGIGVFAPTWESTKSDTPSMGTGTHDVHIVLSTIGGPTSEAGLTPLTSSYVFQAADNGKYVVAFYEGKASTNNTQLSVTKWRTVMESSTLTETFDYSAGGGNMSQSGDIATASIAKSGSTTNETDSLRLGSGSATGTLTVTSSTNLISKIEVWVKSYGSDSATLNVGSENTGTISADEFESFEFTFDDPVSSVAMSTTASKKRVYVQKVVITSGGLNDIGKSADCLGLEVYIDTYLHMSDYTTSEGWCKDEEHNYYGKNTETGAKYHFNQLNAHQRSLLSSNSAYAAEWARLSAWAAANGESLNSSSILAAARISPLANIVGNTNTIAVIVVISMISITCIGGYFFIRKRKEQ